MSRNILQNVKSSSKGSGMFHNDPQLQVLSKKKSEKNHIEKQVFGMNSSIVYI